MANKEKTLSLKAFLDKTGFSKSLGEMKREMDQSGKNFKEAASEAKAFGTKTDELKTKQKYLGDAIKIQGKTVDTLKQAYQKSSEETGENSLATRKLGDEIQKAKIKYNNLHGELRDVNKALDANEQELKDVNRALDDNQEGVKKSAGGWKEWIKGGLLAGGTAGVISKVIGAIGAGLSKVKDLAGGAFDAVVQGATAALGIVKTLAEATGKIVMDSAARADEAATMAAKMGLTTEKIQELQYAAELIDVDLDTMAGSLSKLTGAVKNADKQQDSYNQKLEQARKKHSKTKPVLGDVAKAFKTLKVPLRDADGQFRDMNDIWADTIDALGQVTNEAERDILAMQLYGKSFADLKPLILAGGDALKEYAKKAHEVGYVMTDEQSKSLTELDDSYQKFKGTLTGFSNVIGSSIAPGFKIFFDTINENAPAMQEQLTPALKDLGKALGDSATAIAPHLPALATAAISTIPSIADAVTAMTPAVVKIAEKAPDLFYGMANALDKMPDSTIEKLGDFAINSFDVLADAAIKSADPLTRIIQAVADNSDGLGKIIKIAADKAPGVLNALADFADAALPNMSKYLPGVVDFLGRLLTKLIKLGEWQEKHLGGITPLQGIANAIFGSGGNGKPAFATGGVTPGGVVWTGEHGPEPVLLPKGSRVVSHGEAMNALGGNGARKVVHSGTIRVEGVNSRGDVEAVVDLVVDRLVMEARL